MTTMIKNIKNEKEIIDKYNRKLNKFKTLDTISDLIEALEYEVKAWEYAIEYWKQKRETLKEDIRKNYRRIEVLTKRIKKGRKKISEIVEDIQILKGCEDYDRNLFTNTTVD